MHSHHLFFSHLQFLNLFLSMLYFIHVYRASPSEFVIPLAKYRKAVYGTQLSVGMRFGMMFETEESGKRR